MLSEEQWRLPHTVKTTSVLEIFYGRYWFPIDAANIGLNPDLDAKK